MAKRKVRVNKPYELSRLRQLHVDADKLVLGCDPGSANFGISLVGLKRNRVKIYANSVLMQPLNDLVDMGTARMAFLAEIHHWMRLNPDGICAERFQTRGNSGPLIEYVSVMLGLLGGVYKTTPLKLTIASTWKNKFNKRFECDLKEIYPTTRVQPHQLDASLIGVYGLESGLGVNIDYSVDDIVSQTEQTSLIGLKK